MPKRISARDRLRQAVRETGYREVARQTGIDVAQLHRALMRGHPNRLYLDQAEAVAKACGLRLEIVEAD